MTGTIYEINENLGAFVAVDNKYYGLIPKKELFENFREGDVVSARVTKVRDDGKLDFSPREVYKRQVLSCFCGWSAACGCHPFLYAPEKRKWLCD